MLILGDLLFFTVSAAHDGVLWPPRASLLLLLPFLPLLFFLFVFPGSLDGLDMVWDGGSGSEVVIIGGSGGVAAGGRLDLAAMEGLATQSHWCGVAHIFIIIYNLINL